MDDLIAKLTASKMFQVAARQLGNWRIRFSGNPIEVGDDMQQVKRATQIQYLVGEVQRCSRILVKIDRAQDLFKLKHITLSYRVLAWLRFWLTTEPVLSAQR